MKSIFDIPNSILASDEWKLKEVQTNVPKDALPKFIAKKFNSLVKEDWIHELRVILDRALSIFTCNNTKVELSDNVIWFKYKETILYSGYTRDRYAYIKFEKI